jgi:hypothetical protein
MSINYNIVIKFPLKTIFRYLKDRTRSFYHNHGTNDIKRGILNIGLFLNLFAFWYEKLK